MSNPGQSMWLTGVFLCGGEKDYPLDNFILKHFVKKYNNYFMLKAG